MKIRRRPIPACSTKRSFWNASAKVRFRVTGSARKIFSGVIPARNPPGLVIASSRDVWRMSTVRVIPMGQRVEHGFTHDLHGECRNSKTKQTHCQFAFRVRRTREYGLDPREHLEQGQPIGIVASDLGRPHFTHVMDNVLRTQSCQNMLRRKQEQPCVCQAPVANDTQCPQEGLVRQVGQIGIRVVLAEDVARPGDFHLIEIRKLCPDGRLPAPVHCPCGNLRSQIRMRVHGHAVLAHALLVETLHRPVWRSGALRHANNQQATSALSNLQLLDRDVQIRPR